MLGWFYAFAFTQVVEVPVYLRALDERDPLWLRVAKAFSLSLVTHPFVWFAFPALPFPNWTVQLVVSEAFAVLVEAGMLVAFGLDKRKALLFALFANALSLGLGLASRELFGVP